MFLTTIAQATAGPPIISEVKFNIAQAIVTIAVNMRLWAGRPCLPGMVATYTGHS